MSGVGSLWKNDSICLESDKSVILIEKLLSRVGREDVAFLPRLSTFPGHLVTLNIIQSLT